MKLPTRAVPFTAVFLAGFVGMGLEILAMRVVYPVYGSSTFVWGSVLTVFMLSLGLGYFVGGAWGDRHATPTALAALMLSTGIAIGAILHLTPVVLEIGTWLPVESRYQALLPVALLFGPASFLMGVVSPYATALAADERGTGQAAGNVYAVETLGGIVGGLLTTFVLFQHLGIDASNMVFLSLLGLGSAAISVDRFDTGLLVRAALVVGLAGTYGLGLTL